METSPMRTVALIIFIIASITDYVDGYWARRYNLITNFGKLMDPLVDKIMMSAAFICLIPIGMVPAWAAIVIISREFTITGLRLLAAAQGSVLPAEKLGKHKTTWQMITVIFLLFLHSLKDWEYFRTGELGEHWIPLAVQYGGNLLLAVAVILTLYSGLGYLWKNRDLLLQDI